MRAGKTERRGRRRRHQTSTRAIVYLNEGRCREAGLEYTAPRGAVVAVGDSEALGAVLRQLVPDPSVHDERWTDARAVRSEGHGWWSLA